MGQVVCGFSVGATKRRSNQIHLDAGVPAAFCLRYRKMLVFGSVSVCDDNRDVWNTRPRSVVGRKQLGPHAVQSVVQVGPSHARWKPVRVDGSDDVVDVRISQQIPTNYCPSAKR